MSYYTHFELEVEGPSKDKDALELFVLKNKDDGDNVCYLVDAMMSHNQDGWKWYDYKKDMMEFSKHFPRLLFVLSGKGEEDGDLWKSYFKDGENFHAQAVLTYPEPPTEFQPDK